MKLRTITSRAAVAGATTALAAGALVAVAAPAAQAAEVTNTYVCSNAALGFSFPSEVTVSGTIPVPQYGAGAGVPANVLSLTASATVPADVAPTLAAFGITGAKAKDYAGDLGSSKAPIPLEGDFVSEGGNTTWEASGKNTPFVTPAPGSYEALVPEMFTLTAMQGDTESATLECVLDEGQEAGSFGSLELLQQSSSITVPKKVSAKKGKAVKITASVSAEFNVGVGKVVAKKGKKTLATANVKNGKAVLNLGKKLPVGKHKITVSYLKNASITGSSAKTTVTIKK